MTRMLHLGAPPIQRKHPSGARRSDRGEGPLRNEPIQSHFKPAKNRIGAGGNAVFSSAEARAGAERTHCDRAGDAHQAGSSAAGPVPVISSNCFTTFGRQDVSSQG